ncbi:MAG TPA: hypothetical protein VLT58_03810 [Polyangia bacterium]|nr:hypothetical protein [Polyangia bacterium]
MRNDEVAITIDGHAGQTFVLAAEHAARLRHCRAEQPFAQRDSTRESFSDRAAPRRDILVRITRQNSNGNRVFAIDKTARNKFTVSRQNIDDGAGVLGNAAWPQSVAVNPRMTCLNT